MGKIYFSFTVLHFDIIVSGLIDNKFAEIKREITDPGQLNFVILNIYFLCSVITRYLLH